MRHALLTPSPALPATGPRCHDGSMPPIGDGFATPPLDLDAADLLAAIQEGAGADKVMVSSLNAAFEGGQGRRQPAHTNDEWHETQPTRSHRSDQKPEADYEEPEADQEKQATADGPEEHRQAGPLTGGSSPGEVGHEQIVPPARMIVLGFGTQPDTEPVNGGADGELTPERAAAYIAEYATTSPRTSDLATAAPPRTVPGCSASPTTSPASSTPAGTQRHRT